MKKFLAILLVALIIFTGCETADVSSETSVESAEPSKSVDIKECKKILSAFSSNMLLGRSFTTTKAIKVLDLTAWYGYRLKEQGVDLTPYINEEFGGVVFPAEEFESVIYDFFGLMSGHLKDSEGYYEEYGGYIVDGALFKLVENSYEITDAEISGNTYTIYFDFTIDEETSQKCLLVAEKNEDKITFVSYKRGLDFSTDDIDPVFKTEYDKKQRLRLTDEELIYLKLQAPTLTEHLILTSVDLDNEFTSDEINRFFGLLTKYQNNPDYRYTPILQESQNRQYYLFCFEDIERTAYEVFGKNEWDYHSHLLDIDWENMVYSTDLGYGITMPYFSTDYETAITDTYAEVEFTLYRRGSKDGDPYEFDEGRYVARYGIIKDEAGAFLRFEWIGKKPSSKKSVELTSAKGEITNCTAEETAEYLKTDEATALVTYFGRNVNIIEFSNTSEIVDSDIFFGFVQDILPEIGTVDENADIVVVESAVADSYLEKYFGVTEYDPKESNYYDKYSGKYHFPWATEKSMWMVQDIELESIEQNECTFRYVYSYVADEPPYYGARITFRVMKDENGKFLQVVSCTDVVTNAKTKQEVIDALYSQNLDWQTISCEVPKSPARFVTEDGYKKVEVSSSDTNQSLTFKLPSSFYTNEENGKKIWTDGWVRIRNIHVLYEIDPTKYLEYEKSIWPDPYVCRRTFLNNGIVDTILYPRKDYAADEPSARSHFVDIIYGDKVISFEVSEPWYTDTSTMTTETLSMINAIADSFS